MPFSNPLLRAPTRAAPQALAIVGAGTIGPDIGYYLKSALPDLRVVLIDVAQAALDKARQRFQDYAKKGVERGKMSAELAAKMTQNLHASTDYDAIAGCDWVMEAATEDLELKRRIFASIEERVAADALITSNTSSLPAERIFRDLKHKARATVTHFFAPAWRNPAVEVIRWKHGDPAVLDYLTWLFCHTGKVPFVTADVPCFMLDRIFDNWCNDAGLLLGQATAAEIDAVVAEEFAQVGPFFVLNMSNGNPIITETNTLQANEEGEHYRPAPIFRSVQSWNLPVSGKRTTVPPDTARAVRERMAGVLISQTVDILDRAIGDPADLDLGCRLALGFKRGPLDVMRELGDAETRRLLGEFAAARPGMPMPKRPLAEYQRFNRFILIDDLDGVRVLTVRRPEALNALHDEINDELLAAIKAAESDPAVSGFVITGYGPRAFSAGADIGRFPRMLGDAEAAAQYSRDCSKLLVHLDRMRKPVVAALNGMALGGGLELAMRCHALVAVREAFLQFPEITLGIVPGIGAMVVPYRRWPAAATVFHGMLRRGERLKAPKAFELGILDGLTEDYASLIAAACNRVRALVGKVQPPADAPVTIAPLDPIEPVSATGQPLSRAVLAILEQSIRDAAAASSFAAALEIGYRGFGASACTAAAREGIGAFQEKRTPDFLKTG